MEKEKNLAMLFKQLIKLNYERYINHSHNSRYFFEKFYDAYGLSLAILKKEFNFKFDEKNIEEVQRLWFGYNDINPILGRYDKNEKKYLSLIKNDFGRVRTLFLLQLQSRVNKDQEIINLAMDKMKDVVIEEFEEMKNFYQKGMIAISSSEWWR